MLSLLFVSLIVTGAAVILLAARLIVLRRDGELVMRRARGGSLAQVAAVTARGAVVVVLPAAVIGAGLAVIVVPGYAVSSTLGWRLAGITVAVTLAGPPLIAAWQYRRPVLTEAMPAVLAAVIAGAACAVALPYLIGSSIDLSAFTRTGVPVRFQPDLAALAWPAAAIVLLAAGVLAAQTRALRRHGVTGLLRAH